jgi:hypothetical protein
MSKLADLLSQIADATARNAGSRESISTVNARVASGRDHGLTTPLAGGVYRTKCFMIGVSTIGGTDPIRD